MREILAAAATVLLFAAATARGAVDGVIWRAVDNTPGNPGNDIFAGAQWNGLSQYTFDLILFGDPGQGVVGVNMGDPADPDGSIYGLRTDGATFNHPFGGDVRTAGLEAAPGFGAMQYDTYVDLGVVAGAPIIEFDGVADLDAPGGAESILRASWFTNGAAALDANGEMRILRVTVGYPPSLDPFASGPTGYLGSGPFECITPDAPISWIQVQLVGGEAVDLAVGNAFYACPTPGAAALFGVVGLAGLRRRR